MNNSEARSHNTRHVEAVVLDVGEVLIHLDMAKLPIENVTDWHVWDQFERGALVEKDVCRLVGERMGRVYPETEFRTLWNGILKGPVPGIATIVKELARQVPLYALSNTSDTHMAYLRSNFPWFSHFRKIFTSYELKLRKPERAIYVAVADAIKVGVDKILFIDDRQENVEGAQKAGYRAELCRRSPDDLLAILNQYGFKISGVE